MGIDDGEEADGWTTMAPLMMKKAPHKRAPLETTFRCPLCKRDGSVECRIDLKRRAATASCWACEASYATRADALTEPVDVYGEWIDDCERANDGDGDAMMIDT